MHAWDAKSSGAMAASWAAMPSAKAVARPSRCAALCSPDWMMKASARAVSVHHSQNHTR